MVVLFVALHVLFVTPILLRAALRRVRSWRLLPNVEAGHELCTIGPYGIVRHSIYLALDFLAVGMAAWARTPALILAAVLLLVGGDLRARLEERFLLATYRDVYRAYMDRVARFVPALY